MKALLPWLAAALVLFHAPSHATTEEPEQQFAEFARCELISGEAIEDCRIGYRTVGTLNAARDNAILVPSWFTGTSEGLVDYAAPDALDPSRYFIILVDSLGNGISSSPSNQSAQANGDFPHIAIADMVESQHRLLTETLGIEHLRGIVGLSMGGMQAFEWAVRYPDFADKIVPVIGSPRLASYDIVRWETLIRVLDYARKCQCDEAFELRAGLSMLSQLPETLGSSIPRGEAVTALATRAEREPREVGILWDDQRQAEAMIAHDVTAVPALGGKATLAEAAQRVHGKMFVIVSADDYVVSHGPALEFAQLAAAQSLVLDADCGHGDPWCDAAGFRAALKAFIDRE